MGLFSDLNAHIAGRWSDPELGTMYDWADQNNNLIVGYRGEDQPVWNDNAEGKGWRTPAGIFHSFEPAPTGMTKEQAWATINPNDPTHTNIQQLLNWYQDPAMFQKYGQGRSDWMTSPDGQYSINGDAGGPTLNKITNGPGEPSWGFNDDGTYKKTVYGAKNMTNWQGVLSVIGAAFGFSALGAAAAGGAAAGAGAGAGAAEAGAAAGAGAGLSYTAAGAPVFGVVDTAAGAGAGLGYTAGGAPIFGVVDTSVAAGPGITYSGGAPVFGVVDQGAAEASRAALATQAGGAGGAAGGGAGGGGSGGTTGGGATSGTGAAKAGAQTLGASAVKDKLVGSLVSAGASSLLSSMLSPKPDMAAPTTATPVAEPRPAETKTKAVSEMPDPLAQNRARKRSLVEQLGRRGRASTILTSPSGRLGS